MRVQIPAYTDHWMMGLRFGEIVKVVRRPNFVMNPVTGHREDKATEIAHVKLDHANKVIRVILADCTPV